MRVLTFVRHVVLFFYHQPKQNSSITYFILINYTPQPRRFYKWKPAQVSADQRGVCCEYLAPIESVISSRLQAKKVCETVEKRGRETRRNAGGL